MGKDFGHHPLGASNVGGPVTSATGSALLFSYNSHCYPITKFLFSPPSHSNPPSKYKEYAYHAGESQKTSSPILSLMIWKKKKKPIKGIHRRLFNLELYSVQD